MHRILWEVLRHGHTMIQRGQSRRMLMFRPYLDSDKSRLLRTVDEGVIGYVLA